MRYTRLPMAKVVAKLTILSASSLGNCRIPLPVETRKKLNLHLYIIYQYVQ